jgi:hypothetical protein
MKLDTNDSKSLVLEPLSVPVSLVSLSINSYMHKHDLKWVCMCQTGVVFNNSILRMRVVTLALRSFTSDNFSWRAIYTFQLWTA